jgi:hypothetical protein
MQSDYAGKMSHKVILPLLAERGEGWGEEPNYLMQLATPIRFGGFAID